MHDCQCVEQCFSTEHKAFKKQQVPQKQISIDGILLNRFPLRCNTFTKSTCVWDGSVGAVIVYWYVDVAMTSSSFRIVDRMCYVGEAVTFISVVPAVDSKAMEEVDCVESQ